MSVIRQSGERSHANTAAKSWIENLTLFAGWGASAYLVAMLAWVVVPWIGLGWSPMVVVSGSMSPMIRVGDVVLTSPVEDAIEPGTVVAYDNGSGPVLHRVVDVT